MVEVVLVRAAVPRSGSEETGIRTVLRIHLRHRIGSTPPERRQRLSCWLLRPLRDWSYAFAHDTSRWHPHRVACRTQELVHGAGLATRSPQNGQPAGRGPARVCVKKGPATSCRALAFITSRGLFRYVS